MEIILACGAMFEPNRQNENIIAAKRVHEYAISASPSKSSRQYNEEIAILCHKRHIYNSHLPYAAAADVMWSDYG